MQVFPGNMLLKKSGVFSIPKIYNLKKSSFELSELIPNIVYYAAEISKALNQYEIKIGYNIIVDAMYSFDSLKDQLVERGNNMTGIDKYRYLMVLADMQFNETQNWARIWNENLNNILYKYCLEPNRMYILYKYSFILANYADLMTADELAMVKHYIENLKNLYLDKANIIEANRLWNQVSLLMEAHNLKSSVILEELSKLKNNIATLHNNPATAKQLGTLWENIRSINHVSAHVNFKSPLLDAVATLIEEKNPFNR